MEAPEAVIDIDDSYSMSSELKCEILEDLQRIGFFVNSQRGDSTFFQLYPEDINKLMEFLNQAKLYFKID